MTTTLLKRQKEMKRMEKQRAKAERRAQKKLASQEQGDNPVDTDIISAAEAESLGLTPAANPDSFRQG
jgi:hypothetical protein